MRPCLMWSGCQLIASLFASSLSLTAVVFTYQDCFA
jgi:hypothetical protein